MKRAAIMIIVIMMSVSAMAQTMDISGLSLEALYELRDAVDRRIEALEPGAAPTGYEAGGYLVGRDMPAGEYALIEAEDAIFASVTVRSDDSAESQLIAYSLINRQAMIRLEEGEWVVLSEATAWPMREAPVRTDEGGTVDEGAYLAGEQIPAGEYTVFTKDKAPLSSYSVYTSILCAGGELIRFEVIEDDVVIQLEEGDYIELSGCMMSAAG